MVVQAQKSAPFADLNDLSNLLQRANFTLPVADIDRHKIVYNNPKNYSQTFGEWEKLIY
ncbi:MAG: hypothetical protein CM15mP109_08620 [Candidatus Dadabacteria bacterium]|nr:MAG: hypothetical protein CM15mP109_08620 [Candidatus Dadabacteria bacterium]